MPEAEKDKIHDQLVALSEGDFVALLRRSFVSRANDLDQNHFQSRYALARVFGYPAAPAAAGEWLIEFVADPVGTGLGDGSLSQQGSCLRCGYEAVSEAKSALCGVCGVQIGLT